MIKLKNSVKKYNIILLLLIPIFLTIFYRAYTYDLPITKEFAQDSVYKNIESEIRSNILEQTPDIDQQTLNETVAQRINEYFKNNQKQIQQNIKQVKGSILENYQDESGLTYLLAVDSYHYYRQAKNILDHGHVGDELKDGKPLDNHMLAPNGRAVEPSLHPYIITIVHRISFIFGNDSLMASAFIIPIIIMVLAVIPCFFIVKRFAGKIGATVGASLLTIHPIVLSRTVAGLSDTDTYNIFFPLTIAWLLFESFRTKKPKNKLILAALSGLSTGLFAFAWDGWWFFFDIILATIVIYTIFLIITYKKEFFRNKLFKNMLKSSVPYLIFTVIFVLILTSSRNLLDTIKAPIKVIVLKQAAHPSLWPNVYTTVEELKEISFPSIINSIGGSILVILAFSGPLIIFLTRKQFSSRLKYSLLIIIWLIATFYASTKGIRFMLLVIPAYAIGLGIFTGVLYNKMLEILSRSLKLSKILAAIIMIIIIIIAFLPMLAKANNQAKSELPNFDDTWYSVLTKIKEKTSPNTIITSWWDFGHWFKAMADRRITFDGASQNSPKAHWVGKILLTSNEQEAIGTLKMLDCGSEQAYNILLEKIGDRILTKSVIDKILLQDKETARNTLLKYTDDPEKILEKTHCDPTNALFITSEDMVGKSEAWAHFGSWSFERAFVYNTIKSNSKQETISILKGRLGYSEEESTSLYTQLKGIPEGEGNAWIAGYPSYSSIVSCSKRNETILCQNGIFIENGEAKINTKEGPVNIALYRDDKGVHKNNNGIKDFAVAYIPNKNISVIMSPDLLESMFTELFFYEGKNLDHFELFDHQVGIDQFDIYTWKVKWDS